MIVPGPLAPAPAWVSARASAPPRILHSKKGRPGFLLRALASHQGATRNASTPSSPGQPLPLPSPNGTNVFVTEKQSSEETHLRGLVVEQPPIQSLMYGDPWNGNADLAAEDILEWHKDFLRLQGSRGGATLSALKDQTLHIGDVEPTKLAPRRSDTASTCSSLTSASRQRSTWGSISSTSTASRGATNRGPRRPGSVLTAFGAEGWGLGDEEGGHMQMTPQPWLPEQQAGSSVACGGAAANATGLTDHDVPPLARACSMNSIPKGSPSSTSRLPLASVCAGAGDTGCGGTHEDDDSEGVDVARPRGSPPLVFREPLSTQANARNRLQIEDFLSRCVSPSRHFSEGYSGHGTQMYDDGECVDAASQHGMPRPMLCQTVSTQANERNGPQAEDFLSRCAPASPVFTEGHRLVFREPLSPQANARNGPQTGDFLSRCAASQHSMPRPISCQALSTQATPHNGLHTEDLLSRCASAEGLGGGAKRGPLRVRPLGTRSEYKERLLASVLRQQRLDG